MKSLIFIPLVFLFALQTRSQDFYINQRSEVVPLSIAIPSNWKTLNLNEGNDFLFKTGFTDVNAISNGNKIIVLGKISNKEFTYYRSLTFVDDVIKGYSDRVVFAQPCILCFANEAKSKLSTNTTMAEILENNYSKALKEDERLKNIFYRYQTESLKRDGINTGLLGDITDFGFKFENSINTNEFSVYRNCSLKLDAPAYIFTSERNVILKEKEYYVGNYDLKSINQYDLKLMVDVFLMDCKENNINLKKNQINVVFEQLEGNLLGLSYGINDDSRIILKIDPIKWENTSKPKRWYLVYHELGHDALNLKHGNGGKMMFNFADKGYSWNEFWEDRRYMFESYKRK